MKQGLDQTFEYGSFLIVRLAISIAHVCVVIHSILGLGPKVAMDQQKVINTCARATARRTMRNYSYSKVLSNPCFIVISNSALCRRTYVDDKNNRRFWSSWKELWLELLSILSGARLYWVGHRMIRLSNNISFERLLDLLDLLRIPTYAWVTE